MSIMTLTYSVCMKSSNLVSTNVCLSLQAAGTTTHYLQSIACHLCSFTLLAVLMQSFSVRTRMKATNQLLDMAQGPWTSDTTPGSYKEPGSKLKISTRSPMLNWRWQACWSWLVFICCCRSCTLAWRSGCKRPNCDLNGISNRSSAGGCLVVDCGVVQNLNKKQANLISIEPSVNFLNPCLNVWTACFATPLVAVFWGVKRRC